MKITFTLFAFLMSLSIFGQGTGEVIITEIYNRPLKPTDDQLAAALPNNPDGADTTPNEGHTEWFQVFKTTGNDINMDGWLLIDASSMSNSTVIENFVLPANSYAVFSGFNIPDAQGGVQFDYFYEYKKPSFNNESSYADEGDTACPDGVVIMTGDSTLVDEVRYDYGYGEYIGNPDAGGCSDNETAAGFPGMGSSSRVSFMLRVDPAIMNAADNDLAENWTYSTLTYDAEGGQLGTPGVANDGGVGSGSGEVIITEYYNRPLKPTEEQLAAALPNNPSGSDATPNEGHTEWFEVYNTTNEDIDMEGWIIQDASSMSNFTLISDFVLEANSYAVFSGFNIPEAHGGVEFDYFYDYKKPSFNNESSYADEGDTACPDGVVLSNADVELVDQVLYDYGYGNYIGNEDAGNCRENSSAIGLPNANSSSKVSFALRPDPAVMNAASNDNPANWSFSATVYDEVGGQVGTPGEPNILVTSVDESVLATQFSIYPNPTGDVLNIGTSVKGKFSHQVYDLRGNLMSKASSSNNIDVSQMASGLYLIKISYEGESIVKKFNVLR